MSAVIAEVLPGRYSYLLDSFEGLADVGTEEREHDLELFARGRLVADEEVARDTMRRSGAAFEIARGWFDSLSDHAVGVR